MFFKRRQSSAPGQDQGETAGTRSDAEAIFSHLLLLIDGSDPSIAAANYAMKLAASAGAKVTAIYVIDTATMEYLQQMRIFVTEEREEFEADLANTGKRYLDYASTIAQNHGVKVETRLEKGAIHQVMVRQARELHVDAIVLGGWRRTVTRKDATSVERQLILDEAECPVIVVKAAREKGRS